MLVVNPGLVKDIELIDVVCRPIVFLRDSYLDEWHQRHVDATLKKITL